jgi:hypothetical protein
VVRRGSGVLTTALTAPLATPTAEAVLGKLTVSPYRMLEVSYQLSSTDLSRAIRLARAAVARL